MAAAKFVSLQIISNKFNVLFDLFILPFQAFIHSSKVSLVKKGFVYISVNLTNLT